MGHIGDHAHCDQLSFELSLKGIPVFVDRGSYVYTSDLNKRNLYRSTIAHNVLSINGVEQNRKSGKVFGLMDDTQAKALYVKDGEIKVRHTGFKTLKRNNLSHTRLFRFLNEGRELNILDTVNGVQNEDSIKWYFHLHQELKANIIDQKVMIFNDDNLVCELIFPPQHRVRKERFDSSPSYGRLKAAETLIFSLSIDSTAPKYKSCFQIVWKA